MSDPRRRIPRTDALLADPTIARYAHGPDALGSARVKQVVTDTQDLARRGELAPEEVRDAIVDALAALTSAATTARPVINATGVIVHTNIGRAPLSSAAREALATAAGHVDVELDLLTGRRSRRGAGTLAALLERCPGAGAALVVNNGAAALLLAATALAGDGEILISRGELVEIGDGFRLPELIRSAGAALAEVGTTNRTTVEDYAAAIGPRTRMILKVHPSNFRVEGFTGTPEVADLAPLAREHDLPLVVDIGSGLLAAEPLLPDEPDAARTLTAGADLVTASGDKLLGGPQAGLVLGRSTELVEKLRRHPMQRALRVDKLTLTALEATLRGPLPPVTRALRTDPEELRARTAQVAARLAELGAAGADDPGRAQALEPAVVPVDGRVGGGGAPGHPLPGWALALPESLAPALRTGSPAVLARLEGGRCLVDLRCVPVEDEETLIGAILRAHGHDPAPGPGTTSSVT